jgi:serine/threonine-protein kinase
VAPTRRLADGQVAAVRNLSERLPAEPAFVGMFRREAGTLQRVRHPHVAQVYEYRESSEGAAIVMEAVAGVSLRTELKQRRALDPTRRGFRSSG